MTSKISNGKKGAFIQLDIIPTDLLNYNGVVFLVPVELLPRFEQVQGQYFPKPDTGLV